MGTSALHFKLRQSTALLLLLLPLLPPPLLLLLLLLLLLIIILILILVLVLVLVLILPPPAAATVTCARRYTDAPAELEQLMLERLALVYGCASARKSWLRWQPGLSCGLSHAVRACCRPGTADQVVIATPIYPPFCVLAESASANVVRVPLAEERVEHVLRYSIDWCALEAAIAQPDAKLLLWCSPHNPTGRCWAAHEMVRLARLCVEHEVLIVDLIVC